MKFEVEQLKLAPMDSAVAPPFPLLVVTPTLGSSPWLEQTVESVARLPFRCVHLLVAPAHAVAGLALRFPHIQTIAEPGGGMYAAINAGLAANESWGAFTYLNDDDLLLPPFARLAARVSVDRPQVVYGGVKLIRADGRRAGAIPISSAPSLNRLLYDQGIEPIFQHGAVVTRPVVAQLGGFDASFRFLGDLEFFERACFAGVPFICATRRKVAAFRLRAGQLSKNLPAIRAELRQTREKFDLPQRRTARHRWACLVFRAANVSIYLERIARHGFIGFSEMVARIE
jgi:hypothetical protein